MNESTIDLDQADEDILTTTVSDEALEAAAGTGNGEVYSVDSWRRCGGTICTRAGV